MGSYYLLRPVRDAMATVFGVDQLQNLFTGTLVLTLVCSPLFAWLTDTFKLSRLLPGVFGFLVVNLLRVLFLVPCHARQSLVGRRVLLVVQCRQSLHGVGLLELDG